MKLKLEVHIGPYATEFALNTDELDRNYEDENYAYWIVQDFYGYVHEINIDKDESGEFLLTGRDNIWFNMDDFEDGHDADRSFPIKFERV